MSEPKVTVNTVTTVVQITDYGNGKVEYKELPSDQESSIDLHSGNRKSIDIPLPVIGLGVRGYYDVDDQQLGLQATWMGSPIGGLSTASLNNGISFSIDLWAVGGSIGLAKNGNKLRLSWSLSAMGSTYSDSKDLFDI